MKEEEGEEMEHEEGGMDWKGMKKCGCPMCQRMMAMKKMGMMGMMGGMGMMPGMGMGRMGMPGMGMMGHMGMGMPGMMEHEGGMAPWRKFMSKDEKIEKLEGYLKQLQMEEKAVQEKIDMMREKP